MEKNIIANEMLGGNYEEITIDEWTKKEGETVKEGEIIARILADKVVFEIEAPASGKVVSINYQDGETAAPNDILAVIETE